MFGRFFGSSTPAAAPDQNTWQAPAAPPAAAPPATSPADVVAADALLQLRDSDAAPPPPPLTWPTAAPAALKGFDRVALVSQLQAALASGNTTAAAELIADVVEQLQAALVYVALAQSGGRIDIAGDVVGALDVRLQRVENYFQWDAGDAQRAVDQANAEAAAARDAAAADVVDQAAAS